MSLPEKKALDFFVKLSFERSFALTPRLPDFNSETMVHRLTDIPVSFKTGIVL